MTLYLDLIFIICGIMNYFVISACAELLRCKVKAWSMVAGVAFSAALSVTSFVLKHGIASVLVQLAGTAAVMRITFGKCVMAEFIRRCVVYLGVMFVISSAMNVFTASGKVAFLKDGKFFYVVSEFRFCLGLLICRMITRIIIFFVKNKKTLYDVEISTEDEIIYTKALLDTGNLLCEPESGRPVIVIEEALLNHGAKFCKKIRFKTAGSQEEEMDAVFLKYVRLVEENRTFYDLYGGVVKKNLSKNNEFHVLLHSKFK